MGSSLARQISGSLPLKQLTSLQEIELENTPFWDSLLGAFPIQLSTQYRGDDKETDQLISTLCSRLIRNNCKSRNFAKLVLFLCSRLICLSNRPSSLSNPPSLQMSSSFSPEREREREEERKRGEEERKRGERGERGEEEEEEWRKIANGMFLVRVFTRYFYCNYGEGMVVLQYSKRPSPSPSSLSSSSLSSSSSRLSSVENGRAEKRDIPHRHVPLPTDDISEYFMEVLANSLIDINIPQLYIEILQTIIMLLTTIPSLSNIDSQVNQHDIPLSYFAPWQSSSSSLLVNAEYFPLPSTTTKMFYDPLMTPRCRPTALLSRLLSNFSLRTTTQPPETETRGALSSLFSYFLPSSSPLSLSLCPDLEVSLMLLLMAFQTQTSSSFSQKFSEWRCGRNAFRRLLLYLQDSYKEGPDDFGSYCPLTPVPFQNLFNQLCRMTEHFDSPSAYTAYLFLYYITLGTPSFRRYLLARTDADMLLSPLAHHLYYLSSFSPSSEKGEQSDPHCAFYITDIPQISYNKNTKNPPKKPPQKREPPPQKKEEERRERERERETRGRKGEKKKRGGEEREERERDVETKKMYPMVIILLLLSEDESLNVLLREIRMPTVPWYKEENLQDVSLQDLLVLVLCRICHRNLHKNADFFIQRTAMGALVNMSRHFVGLHTSAAQRLLRLLETSKKKVSAVPKQNQGLGGNWNDLAEFTLDLLFQCLNGCLSQNIKENPYLIYTLVHQKNLFGGSSFFPSLSRPMLENIQLVVNYFAAHLHSGEKISPEIDVLFGKINEASKSWDSSVLLEVDEYDYVYNELDNSDDFFLDYIYEMLAQLDQKTFTHTFAGPLSEENGPEVLSL